MASSPNDYHVFMGQWFDHATNTWILTLDKYWGGVLASALVVWVGVVVSTSWNLVKFIIHLVATAERYRPAFIEQLLVVVRNSGSAPGFVWTCMKMFWRWRGWRRFLWLIGPVIFALTIYGLGTWAKISVSLIESTTGDAILLDPVLCGHVPWSHIPATPTSDIVERINTLNTTLDAQTRVTLCSGSSPDSLACGGLPKVHIKWEGSDARCPLKQESLCITENAKPYAMTSEFVHSSRDLGIDADDENSVLYRRRTTCQPTHLSPFVSILDIKDTPYAHTGRFPPNSIFQLFHLGPLKHTESSFEDETFNYNEWTPYFPFGYDVTTVTNEPGGVWVPNSTLWDRDDATISLFFVTAGHTGYEAPVEDPVFEATRKYTVPVNKHLKHTYWGPTYYVNALTCIDQHQICNPNKGSEGCTPFTAWPQILSAAADPAISLSSEQYATVERISYTFFRSDMADVVDGRGGSALLASRSVYGTIQIPLPVDWWRVEVGNWFSIQLALLQQRIVDYAAGPRYDVLNDLVQTPSTEYLRKQCHSQRIRLLGSNYRNFNLTAICIVASVGLTLIVFFLLIDKIFAVIQQITGDWGGYQRRKWIMDSCSHLIAEVLSAYGAFWDEMEEEIPKSKDRAAAFDFSDPEKPHRVANYPATKASSPSVSRADSQVEGNIIRDDFLAPPIRQPIFRERGRSSSPMPRQSFRQGYESVPNNESYEMSTRGYITDREF